MKYFQFSYNCVVSEAFKMAIDAIRKDINEASKTSDVKLTFQLDGTIKLDVKAALDNVKASFEAVVVRDRTNESIKKAKLLCPALFLREIEQVLINNLEVYNKETLDVNQLNGTFSGLSDSTICELAYELIRLAYLQNLKKDMPKYKLVMDKFHVVQRYGMTYFVEKSFDGVIYDQFGNTLSTNDGDYDEIFNLFQHKLDDHRMFCGYKEYDGFVILGFKDGFHVEADGFNAADNMW